LLKGVEKVCSSREKMGVAVAERGKGMVIDEGTQKEGGGKIKMKARHHGKFPQKQP